MSKTGSRSSVLAILGSLGWPLFLGGWASGVFFMLMFWGPLNTPLFHRYFAGHPTSVCEVVLFFVGLAALLLKFWNLLGQYSWLGRISLPEPSNANQSVDECGVLLDGLEKLPARARDSYLGRRLREALEHVERTSSCTGLDDELKYLSDMDAARQQDAYGLPRIVIWAIPMLGFLGTVMGITQALGGIDPKLLATEPEQTMKALLAGLYVAFDTTAEALSLSMVLMFVQFLIDRIDTQLLSTVDARASEELSGRFEQIGAGSDPNVASIERMGRSVLKATEQLVETQAQLWKSTIDTAHDEWGQVVEGSTAQVQSALAGALAESLRSHAEQLAQAEQASAEQLQKRWEQWQVALSENARLMKSQQAELMKLGEIMLQVVQATGEVTELERSLNGNLQALAGAQNFEETVMSLSAAIHLLNTRLAQSHEGVRHVELGHFKLQGRAA